MNRATQKSDVPAKQHWQLIIFSSSTEHNGYDAEPRRISDLYIFTSEPSLIEAIENIELKDRNNRTKTEYVAQKITAVYQVSTKVQVSLVA